MRTGDYELSITGEADRRLRLLAIAGIVGMDKAARRRRVGGVGGGSVGS
jgi:hypothetical protein